MHKQYFVANLRDTEEETAAVGLTYAVSKPFTEVYRVDLGQQKWCRDDCAQTSKVEAITKTQITFEKLSIASDKIQHNAWANRESGDYHNIRWEYDYRTARSGNCIRVNFTGFPERKF